MSGPNPATTEWVPMWSTNPIYTWIPVPFASLAFSTNTGTWTVVAGNVAYFKYLKVGELLAIKCAITGTAVVTAGTELRVLLTGIPLLLKGNDSFGFTVYTQDGFGTQDVGQSILRVVNNSLVFKTRTGAAWTAGGGGVTGIIANLIGEVTL